MDWEKQLEPPYLELGFYFSEFSHINSQVNHIVKALNKLGATLAGTGRVFTGPKLPAQILWTSSPEEVDATIDLIQFSQDEFETIVQDRTHVLYEVDIFNAVGLAEGERPERITHIGIPYEVSHRDHHPIAILTEYVVFDSSTSPWDITPEIAKASQLVLGRFFQIIELTQPSYATIDVAWSIPCPADLERDPRSDALTNVYVDRNYLGSNNIDTIREAYDGAYMLDLKYGTYFSCWPFFNPEQKRLKSAPSKIIGKMIADKHNELNPS